jgi:hypothetical protein
MFARVSKYMPVLKDGTFEVGTTVVEADDVGARI